MFQLALFGWSIAGFKVFWVSFQLEDQVDQLKTSFAGLGDKFKPV